MLDNINLMIEFYVSKLKLSVKGTVEYLYFKNKIVRMCKIKKGL